MGAIATREERVELLRGIADNLRATKGTRRYAARILGKMGIGHEMLDPFPCVPKSFTEADYKVLYDKQGGACAICGIEPDEREKGLVTDHDHGTGRVRGLLCNSCNTGIGMLGDDVETLEAAVAYLKAAP